AERLHGMDPARTPARGEGCARTDACATYEGCPGRRMNEQPGLSAAKSGSVVAIANGCPGFRFALNPGYDVTPLVGAKPPQSRDCYQVSRDLPHSPVTEAFLPCERQRRAPFDVSTDGCPAAGAGTPARQYWLCTARVQLSYPCLKPALASARLR